MTPAELRQIAAKLEAWERLNINEEHEAIHCFGWSETRQITSESPFTNTQSAVDLVRECFPDHVVSVMGPLIGKGYLFEGRVRLNFEAGHYAYAPTPSAAIMAAACYAKAEQMESGQ